MPTDVFSAAHRPTSPTASLSSSSRSFLDEDPYAHKRPSSSQLGGDGTNLLARLESLLVQKANEIQLAGRLGESLLAQQAQLEARIRELDEVQRRFLASPESQQCNRKDRNFDSDADTTELGAETKRKLEELEAEMRGWDENNASLYDKVAVAADKGIPTEEDAENIAPGSPRRPLRESSSVNLLSPLSDRSAARRARNAGQHRTNDIELATEIGQSLLVEVRRLQALLTEKDGELREVREAKDELVRERDHIEQAKRTIEDALEKCKDENWNLELASQDLRTALTNTQASLSKAETERNKLAKDIASLRETYDTQKVQQENLTASFEALKSKHETEMANARKHAAGLQREKGDLQSTVDNLKTELAMKGRGIKRSTSNSTALNESEDVDLEIEDSAAHDENDLFRGASRRKTGEGFPSPKGLFDELSDLDGVPRGIGSAATTGELKASLAHAMRTIATLKSQLAREKASKVNGKKAAAANESDWQEESSRFETPPKTVTRRAARGGARGSARGRRGGLAPSRLGREIVDDSSFIDEQDESDLGASSPSASPIPEASPAPAFANDMAEDGAIFDHRFGDLADRSSEDGNESGSDLSPASVRNSKRFSGDMDPLFAQFQHSPSAASIRPASLLSVREADEPVAKTWEHKETMTDFAPPAPQIIERVVEVPVERIVEVPVERVVEVEKLVEVPVEKIVERTVEVPVEKIVERIVEVPVEKLVEVPVEKVVEVEKRVEVPVEVEKIVERVVEKGIQVPGPERIVEVQVEKIVEVPVPGPERVVEKIVEVQGPERIVEKVVEVAGPERVVEKLVEVAGPERVVEVPVEKIVTVEGPERIVERVVEGPERIVERVVEVPVEKIVERHVEVPGPERVVEVPIEVEKIVERFVDVPGPERIVEKHIEVPVEVEKIVERVVEVPGPERVVEKRVEVPVEKIVEKRVEVPVERIVERVVEVPVERVVEKLVDVPGPERIVERIVETPGPERIVERIVETPGTERVVEKIVEVFIPAPVVERSLATKASQSTLQTRSGASMPRESFDTDRHGYSETDGEFEDARETIGQYTPHERDSQFLWNNVSHTLRADKAKETNSIGVQTDEPVNAGVETLKTRKPAVRAKSFVESYRQSVGTYRPITPQPFSAGDDGETLQAAAATANAFLGSTAATYRPRSAASRPISPFTPVQDENQEPTSPMGPPKVPRSKVASSRKSTASLQGGRPSRPTSPPPADLLMRAQSPVFDDHERKSLFLTPASAISRPTTPHLRSQASAQSVAQLGPSASIVGTPRDVGKSPRKREQSTTSRKSFSSLSMRSEISRRLSFSSSRTSEADYDDDQPVPFGADMAPGQSTDPEVIHAITQTMIGEFLYKYTRRPLGKGMSEKRHKRFFWIHPYTKTLYWSSSDPGAVGTNQSSAKSVFIEGVRQVVDPNPDPPGLHNASIVIKTPNRDIKLTAPTKERHEMWFNAIKYLLTRPEDAQNTVTQDTTASYSSVSMHETPSGTQQRAGPSSVSGRATVDPDTSVTPKGMYSHQSASDSRVGTAKSRRQRQSVGSIKRPGTAAEQYERRSLFGSPKSVRIFRDIQNYQPANESVEVVDPDEIPDHVDDPGAEWEGLENVRACCNGKHDVGSLSRKQHHHHHHGHKHHSDASHDARPRPRSSIGTIASTFSRKTTANSSPRKKRSTNHLGAWNPSYGTPLGENTQ